MTARGPKDFPAIMSGPMVRALIDGRKTQTRRLLYSERRAKDPAIIPASATVLTGEYRGQRTVFRPVDRVTDFDINTYHTLTPWHRVRPGDRVWIRENWRADDYAREDPARTIYQADASAAALIETRGVIKWRPSIHLPRPRSRITLSVTATRIERLQDISEDDVKAEGAAFHDSRPIGHHGWSHDHGDVWATARLSFNALWVGLHGHTSWAQNPWVVALTFTVAMQNIDSRAAA